MRRSGAGSHAAARVWCALTAMSALLVFWRVQSHKEGKKTFCVSCVSAALEGTGHRSSGASCRWASFPYAVSLTRVKAEEDQGLMLHCVCPSQRCWATCGTARLARRALWRA